jgi:hypothetical protein
MAHLTTSVLNKPPFPRPSAASNPALAASFEFPAEFRPVTHPLSPPDTESDFVAAPAAPISMAMPLSHSPLPPSGLSIELGVSPSVVSAHHPPPTVVGATTQETAAPRFRRGMSSLSYVSPGLRDTPSTRERSSAPKSRWLVVVIPPAVVTVEQQHGQVTQPHGTGSRLSQGVLMPLFPSVRIYLTL